MAFEEFNPSKNYYAGKFIWKDSNLFQFIKDHPAGRWTGNDVKLVSGKRLVNMIEDEEQKEASKSEVLQPTETGSIVTPITAESQTPSALTVSIEPVQDLHGYDNPWPAGGGVNIMPTLTPGTYESNGIRCVVNSEGLITVTGQKTITTSVSIYFPMAKAYGAKTTHYIHLRNSASFGAVTLSIGGRAPTFSGTNRIVKFDVDKEDTTDCHLYIGDAVTQELNFTFQPSIELTNSSTSWTPYSNVCPISGHTQAVVTRTCVNMLNPANAEIGTAWNGGSNTARARLVIPFFASTTFTLSMNGTNNMSGIYVKATDVIPATDAGTSVTSFPYTSSSLSGQTYIVISFSKTGITQDDVDALKLQLELGSSASSYSAYSGTSVTIDLGGTRYGGMVDVLTGVMTVTWAMFDMGDVTWTYDSTYTRFYSTISDLKTGSARKTTFYASALVCIDDGRSISSVPNNAVYSGGTGDKNVYVKSTDYTDADTFKTAFDGQTIVYPLAYPLTVTLDPHTLQLLAGENVVWADTGNVSLTYRADTKAYIDKLFTALQALALEN